MRTSIRSVENALRRAESVLMRNARRNAWAAVCENRRIAADRDYGFAVLSSAAESRHRA